MREVASLQGFGEALQTLRTRRALTLDDVARVLELHPSTLCRYERGDALPKLEVLGRILDALDADFLDLGLLLRGSRRDCGQELDLPPGLSEEERSSLALASSALRDFIEAVARRFDLAPPAP